MNTKSGRPGLIKSALQACARWAGIPVDAGDGIAYNLAGRDDCGQLFPGMSAKAALRISAVWACVSLLSDTISTLPLVLYRRTSNGRVPDKEHPLYRVFAMMPNTEMTSSQFLGATIATMLLRGVAYWEKQINAGRVIGLKFLAYDCLSVTKDINGNKTYRYTENGKTREIPASRVVSIIGFSLNGKDGLSSIQYAANVFGAARSAETAAASTFWRGLLQTVFFKFPSVLREDQRKEARATIESMSGALNAGKPVIMEAGMEAGNIGINPVDAQLLESRAFSVEEICSWFRVQPFMIGRASQGQTNWGTGIEQQMIGFVTFTLRPWLKRIEQSIQKDVLAPEERSSHYAEFGLEGLLRGDSAARAAFYSSGLQNGWMNRNIVADLENLPKPPGGEKYTVQSNLIDLEQLGTTPQPAQDAQDAIKRWLGLDLKDDDHEA